MSSETVMIRLIGLGYWQKKDRASIMRAMEASA